MRLQATICRFHIIRAITCFCCTAAIPQCEATIQPEQPEMSAMDALLDATTADQANPDDVPRQPDQQHDDSSATPETTTCPCRQCYNSGFEFCVQSQDNIFCLKSECGYPAQCGPNEFCVGLSNATTDVMTTCVPASILCMKCNTDNDCGIGASPATGQCTLGPENTLARAGTCYQQRCTYHCDESYPCPEGFECQENPEAFHNEGGTACVPLPGTCE